MKHHEQTNKHSTYRKRHVSKRKTQHVFHTAIHLIFIYILKSKTLYFRSENRNHRLLLQVNISNSVLLNTSFLDNATKLKTFTKSNLENINVP